VSGCRSHADDIGPYVLGALEPGEMDAMRRHLETCPRCAAEERRLAGLPALLDQAHADDAVVALSPKLEEAVLDRYVRDRAGAPEPRRRLRLPAFAVAAAACIALVLAVLLWPGDGESAYARADMKRGGAWVSASVAAVEAGTKVDLEAGRLRRGMYELWCVREDGRWVSGGSFRAHGDGSADAELTAAVSPGEYHTVVITRRSSGGERGAEVMRGQLVY
jgi:hypothetical protein